MMQHLFEQYHYIDLTHCLHPEIPTWQVDCGFEIHHVANYENGYRTEQLKINAGIGTHMDAPLHFFPEGMGIADIPLSELILPICVIDVSSHANADYLVSPEDILANEQKFGAITPNSLVIAYTGWSQHWDNPTQYVNIDNQNLRHFPAFAPQTAEMLIQRQVSAIGIDTLSPDTDTSFPVHKIILGNSKYIVENIANAHLLPARGAYAWVMPLKIRGGTEAPLRLCALIPK